MVEIKNLEFMAKSNPAAEAAETTLACGDSMYIMQKHQTDIGLEKSIQSQQQRSGALQTPVQSSQQHDTRGVQLMQDDAPVLSFQDSVAMQTIQTDVESVESEADALRTHMKMLESGQLAILAALNGLQKPSGSVQTSSGNDSSSLMAESGGPRTTGQG
jgi:hypothetical protein